MSENKPISIRSRREPFWDEYLIDTSKTTATIKLHHPQPKEVVMTHDAPWEGDGCNFHCILKDDNIYRMYYLAWNMLSPDGTTFTPGPLAVAYAESRDGLNWTKPNLGLCEFNGSKDNNIILDKNTNLFDNFSVFKDPNPNCPADEKYKGIGKDSTHYLWCFTSPDGIHFKKDWTMTKEGKFDTLNIALWDPDTNRYRAYIRNFHDPSGKEFEPGKENLGIGVRDVRWMESEDFKIWTTPKRLDFGDAPDYPLYTNVVQPYYRANHVYVGFPTRYVERKEWTNNFDQLTGSERRKQRVKIRPRFGLTVTDCVFMCSRNGKQWNRWDEAFMRPGPEREYNWVYGDCYPSVGMIETPSHLPHAGLELSMYAPDNHWGRIPAELRRYTIRIDGFASYNATFQPQRVVTKPFVFTGSSLFMNFSTSAAGYMKISLHHGDTTLESGEIFGDSIDRNIVFENGDLSALAGKPVTMEIEMSDADVYSFIFKE